ncbi:uncharacterized protein Sfp84E [Drosophila pseudoobscura]|uniref:Uncharacterized protein Sfp84E n=1 Tax=Drosophila pseudoobscura pseudoobscura TaxID=46245 RepID=A0A6I8V719_DROPS|nr:uncharacterized protein LOC13036560 [Drosophila pseudoobscura]
MRFGTAFSLGLALCLLLLLHTSSSEARKRNQNRAAKSRSSNPIAAIEYFDEPERQRTSMRNGLNRAHNNPGDADYGGKIWDQDKTLLRHQHLTKRLSGGAEPGAAFFNQCRSIFKEENFAAHVVAGILDSITTRLEQLCADKAIHPLYKKMVAGNLFCHSNVLETMDMLLDLLLDQVEKRCEDIPGFHGIFIFTK